MSVATDGEKVTSRREEELLVQKETNWISCLREKVRVQINVVITVPLFPKTYIYIDSKARAQGLLIQGSK